MEPSSLSVARRASRASPRTRALGIGRRHSRRAFALLMVGFVLLLVAGVILAVGAGAVSVAPSVSARIVVDHVLPGTFPVRWTPLEDQIIWSFRLPRVLLGVIVGAGMGVVGAVLQTMTRNPLAEPVILGVASGAAFGAVVVFVLGSQAVGGLGLSSAAFAGALLAMSLVYAMAQRRGRLSAPRMLLAGVALAYLFNAGYNYLLLQTDTLAAAQSVLFWLLGSIAGADWELLSLPAGALAVGVVALLAQARSLNALHGGDETAASLGIHVWRFQIQMLVLTSLVIGVMVAVSGQVAFVGLVVPHVARLIVGADHRRVLPLSALLGAFFLVIADLAARTLNAPNELPLTIVTAFVGVPSFLWLLRHRPQTAAEALG